MNASRAFVVGGFDTSLEVDFVCASFMKHGQCLLTRFPQLLHFLVWHEQLVRPFTLDISLCCG